MGNLDALLLFSRVLVNQWYLPMFSVAQMATLTFYSMPFKEIVVLVTIIRSWRKVLSPFEGTTGTPCRSLGMHRYMRKA